MRLAELLHETHGVTLGRFVLSPDDDGWHEVNDIGHSHHVAFPLTPVWISHRPQSERACDANQLVLYDSGARYSRRMLSPRGDTCLFLTLGSPVLTSPYRFPADVVPCPPAVHLALHTLHRRLPLGLDALAADVALVEVAQRVLATIGATPAAAVSTALVEETKALLALRYAEPLRLAEIAGNVGSSPFHLARAFKEHTGETLHGYRNALRLRHVVATAEGHLSDVAVAAGFAHHSHLTERFRRYYGMTPSTVLRLSGSGGGRPVR